MSLAAIGPVIARIQSIESRFGVPTAGRLAQPGSADFAAALSAAFTGAPAGVQPGSSASTTAAGALSESWGPVASPGQIGGYATPLPGTGAGGATAGASHIDPSTPFASYFETSGSQHGVPPHLLAAVGWVESRYQTDAVSSAGAMGVMQIMPFVATELGVDPYDPAQAIDGAARLLRSHYERFGSWDLALAAYNAGAGAVNRAGNAIPSPGVAEYVRRVNERMMTS